MPQEGASFWLGLLARYDLETTEWEEGEGIAQEFRPPYPGIAGARWQ